MNIKIEDIPYNLHTMVDITGMEGFLEICKMYGGTMVYIPVYHKAVLAERNRQIAKQYNGRNIDNLRVKYGISNQQIKRILEREGAL